MNPSALPVIILLFAIPFVGKTARQRGRNGWAWSVLTVIVGVVTSMLLIFLLMMIMGKLGATRETDETLIRNGLPICFMLSPVIALALLHLLPTVPLPPPPPSQPADQFLPRPKNARGGPPPVLYYLYQDGAQTGPFGLPQLRAMAAGGEILPGAQYTFKGATEWQPIERLHQLLQGSG